MARRDGLFMRSALSFVALLLIAVAVTGCGFAPGLPTSSGSLNMQGSVMGGQQPIVNAQVALYVAGTGGNGTAATNLMGTGTGSPLAYTTTDSNGNFSITGDYTCPAATSNYTPQAYIVATGGNPGLSTNPSNSAIVLMDVLGPCTSANIGQNTVITIDEVTTVAAAWALAPFMTSYANVASSATNGTGIANAFLNAQLIADPATGISPGSAFNAISNSATAGTVTNFIESSKVYALANVIATCVDSDGTTPCTNLYKTIGLCNSCTSDTLTAALYIVQHPGQNVAATFGLITPQAPYAIPQPPTGSPYKALTLPPNDWTLSMTVNGGGLAAPTGVGVDTAGNVWVADFAGGVSAFSPQGSTLASPSTYPNGFGYGNAALGFGSGKPAGEIYGLTVDSNNLVWVSIYEASSGSGSVTALNGISSGQTLGSVIGAEGGSYIYFPASLASGYNGEVIVGNQGDGTASIFGYVESTNTTTVYMSSAGYPLSAEPTDVAGDANGGVWLADTGSTTVTHVDANGNFLSHPTCCDGASGIATDKFGDAWASNYYDNSLSEISPGCDSYSNPGTSCYGNQTNVVLIGDTSSCGQTNAPAGSCGAQNGGLYYPQKIVIDAAQNIWVANYGGQTISELAGNASTVAPGTGISPSTTYNPDGSTASQGGYGLDANMFEPYGIALDASGNIWVASETNNNLVMFFGLAAPTATPRLPVPVAP